jgi:hypothetical protein
MSNQNYSNHRRLVPGYHFFTLLGIIVLLIGSVMNLINTADDNLYSASLLVFGTILLGTTAFYTRVFALKAQDRAIRAEENFRHYLLTGKPLDSKLTIRQVIGLRFASDDEFAELAKKAITDNLSENDIKKSIKNWKADTYRV